MFGAGLLAQFNGEGDSSVTGNPLPTAAQLPTSWGSCLANGDVATLACIPTIFAMVMNWVFGLGAIVALFFVLFSGIRFLTSGGDAKQVEAARKTLTFAIIGLVVILLSFAIINLIAALFMPTNIKCLTTFSLLTDSACK